MFWGVTILGGRRYTQTVERSYHISKAALEIAVDSKDQNKKRVQLMLEQNKSHFLLCNLDTDKNVQVDLDLIFTEGEEVTFYLNGQGTVHLTGYVLDFDDVDYDEESSSDEESEDEMVNNNAKRLLNMPDSLSPGRAKRSKVIAKASVNGLADEDEEDDEEDDDVLGALDAGLDSDEDDEEEDEEDEEDDDEEEVPILQKQKPAQKQVNGQVPKLQQQQQKGTPAKGQQNQQNQKNVVASAGKQNQGGQQNKIGQKGQNSPQGQKPLNQNQKGGNQQPQQKGQFNQNKQQANSNNKAKGPFTPDQKASNKFNKNVIKMRKSFA